MKKSLKKVYIKNFRLVYSNTFYKNFRDFFTFNVLFETLNNLSN